MRHAVLRLPGTDGVELQVLHYPRPEEEARSRPVSPQILPDPIVFVPGWISDPGIWKRLIGGLVREAELFHVQPRDKPSATLPRRCGFSMARHAADLEAVLETLGLRTQRFHLVGSSTGANIILEHQVRYARTPAAAALMLPMRRYRFPLWGRPFLYLPWQLYGLLKPAIRLHLRLFESDRGGDREMLEANYYSMERIEPRRAQLSARALQRYSFPEAACGIQPPVLVAGASLDRMHDPTLASGLARALPKGHYLEVGESGRIHSAWMAERLLSFFRRRSSS